MQVQLGRATAARPRLRSSVAMRLSTLASITSRGASATCYAAACSNSCVARHQARASLPLRAYTIPLAQCLHAVARLGELRDQFDGHACPANHRTPAQAVRVHLDMSKRGPVRAASPLLEFVRDALKIVRMKYLPFMVTDVIGRIVVLRDDAPAGVPNSACVSGQSWP